MLWNKDDLGMTQRYDASAKAAQEIGVTVQPLGVRQPDDFNEAFGHAMNRRIRRTPISYGHRRAHVAQSQARVRLRGPNTAAARQSTNRTSLPAPEA